MLTQHTRLCGLERLEPREMLSAAGLAAIQAHPTVLRTAGGPAVAGLRPAQVAHAYGFDQLGSVAGSQAANGTGQTIAIVDAFDDAAIAGDLKTFDSTFGLAAPPSFQKVNQQGGAGLPSASPSGDDWTEETSLDVEWAHAMAPGAKILLVEAESDYLGDLLTAVACAANAPGVSVVSMSWGCSEFPQETQLDSYFSTPAGHGNVTFVASVGDDGVPGLWPAFSPSVVAVGGTGLQTSSSSGSYRTEIGWSFGGGGFSQYEREPSYQAGVQSSGVRTIPDVAYDADPQNGFAVCDSLDPYATAGWDVIGGTSAGAPQWAALLAVANAQRAASHLPALRAAAADLYQLPIADFHDVTAGANGFSAGAGYDLVTGRGSPYANRIVHALASPTISSVQGSARPVQSDLPPSALSKLLANRGVVGLVAWDAASGPQRRGHDAWLTWYNSVGAAEE
jgi:subtilase family serine protease